MAAMYAIWRAGGAVLHDYSPEKFGLTKDELSSGPFAAYMKKFGIDA